MQTMEALVALGSIVDQAADEGEQWVAARRAEGKEVPSTYYDAEEVVDLDTADYLKRWSRHLRLPKAVFVVASVYLDRFVEKRKVSITHYNKFRALLCCLVTADKFLNDRPAGNKTYAKTGGVELEELNHLERMFLADIRFGLYVSNSLYEQYCDAWGFEEDDLDQQGRSTRLEKAARAVDALPSLWSAPSVVSDPSSTKLSNFGSPARSHDDNDCCNLGQLNRPQSVNRVASRARLTRADSGMKSLSTVQSFIDAFASSMSLCSARDGPISTGGSAMSQLCT
eukprot:TRINITY_DN5404_c0_g1_i3.p1 TRINITY_DN5404_c0_g1~~TRINITY_DN5404_c0_g1_i3.p1  ORF type:complete len:283 (+),score=49.24 TRINITY_DN5404_c0_g1_i3:24-872(+)